MNISKGIYKVINTKSNTFEGLVTHKREYLKSKVSHRMEQDESHILFA